MSISCVRNAALVLLLLPALLLAAGGHEHHQAGPESPPCGDPAKPPGINCGLAPSATFDEKGRLWVAWAFAGHIYVSQSGDQGQSFTPPVVVNRTPEPISARGENRPKIALDSEGRVFVSWTMPLEKRFSGHVRFSRSLDGGRSYSDPITVNDNLEITGHRFDALGVNQRGDIYIAWLDKRDRVKAEREGRAYRGAALYFALSTDHGGSFQTNAKVLDNTCECCRVAIAMDHDQLPVIMWRNIYGENTRDHALVKFADRMRPGEAQRVSFDEWQIDACPHHGPAITVAPDGRYHATWFNNAPQRHGLFYAHSSNGGKSFSTPLSIGDYDKNASHPDVVSRGDQVYLVWREYDGKQNTLHLMHSADRGDSWGAAVQVAATQGDADYPFLLTHGEAVYLYWHTRNEGFQVLRLDGGQYPESAKN